MRIKTCLALAVAGAFSISAALATTLKEMTLTELSRAASVAVVGEITASRAAQTENGLVTVSTVRVEKSMWGTNASTIQIEVMGGSEKRGKFNLGTTVAGSPILVRNQKAVFLLDRANTSDNFTLVGFNQGLLPVRETSLGAAVTLPGTGKEVSLAAAMNEINEAKASSTKKSADGIQR